MKRLILLFCVISASVVSVFPQSLDSLIKKALIKDWNRKVSMGMRPFYAYKVLGIDSTRDAIDYYFIVLEADYRVDGVYLKSGEISIIPLKIEKTSDTVIGYRPMEGEDYSQSVRKIFPPQYQEQVFHRHFNSEMAQRLTRHKALNYWHFRKVYLFYPESWTDYENVINRYVNGQLTSPMSKVRLRQRAVYFYPTDSIKYYVALAEYRLHSPFANRKLAKIQYFKQRADTVYILLNADEDGWAGVSFFLAQVHPLIERALLQFPDVRAIIWDYASDDKR